MLCLSHSNWPHEIQIIIIITYENIYCYIYIYIIIWYRSICDRCAEKMIGHFLSYFITWWALGSCTHGTVSRIDGCLMHVFVLSFKYHKCALHLLKRKAQEIIYIIPIWCVYILFDIRTLAVRPFRPAAQRPYCRFFSSALEPKKWFYWTHFSPFRFMRDYALCPACRRVPKEWWKRASMSIA